MIEFLVVAKIQSYYYETAKLEEFLVVAKIQSYYYENKSISSTLEIIEDKKNELKRRSKSRSSDENPEIEVNVVNFEVFCDTNPDGGDHDTGRIIAIITMLCLLYTSPSPRDS